MSDVLSEALVRSARARQGLASKFHQVATATVHLRTLTRDFGVRLLDVPTGTPPGPAPEISRQSANLHALVTTRGEKCGGDCSPGKAGGIKVSRSKRIGRGRCAAPWAPLQGAGGQLSFS